MADIKVLDKEVWGKIAAGEVVEKPASIVKELVENSIDAGAKNITIEIIDGGTKLINIVDDGCGIKSEQISLAFVPHATSKLTKIDDLYNLSSMGFRGEALASIAAVSKVELSTKTESDEIGHKMVVEGGEQVSLNEIAFNCGTQIKVSNLFYNTPARAKFLRKPKTEESDITTYVEKLMLSHSNINFKYIVDSKLVYNTTNCSILDIIYTIYGKEVASSMIEVNYTSGDYNVSGYVSMPTVCKSNRTYQTLFVNDRYCINQLISASISNAYDTFLMKGKFPVYVLFLTLPKNCVDVNVHPNKLEVKFDNSQHIYGLFNNAVYDALSRQTHIKDAIIDIKEEPKFENITFNTVKSDEGVSFSKVEEEINNNDSLFVKPQTSLKFEQPIVYSKMIETEITASEPKQEEIVVQKDYVKDEIKEQQTYENMFELTKKVVGVAFNTYIIIEEGETLYFIDQHAAHERQLFDKFMEQIKNEEVEVQDCLIPYVLNVNNSESDFIESNLSLFKEYGFNIESFGKNTFRVSTIPLLLSEINLKEYFDEILFDLSGTVKKPYEVIRNFFATKACKAAVKAGNKLSSEEIDILIRNLKENNNTLLCPHGRPIVITFDKKQIEKMFKRIV